MNPRTELGELASKLFVHLQRVYSASHEYRVISPDQFPHLDIGFYDEAQRSLEEVGFTHVCDMENNDNAPDLRTFTRYMADTKNEILSEIFEIRPIGGTKQRLFWETASSRKFIGFITEFADGTFLKTSNSRSNTRFPKPPGIITFQNRNWALASEILPRHLDHISWLIAQKPGVCPIAIETPTGIIESATRYSMRMNNCFNRRDFDIKQFMEHLEDDLHPSEIQMITAELLAKLPEPASSENMMSI